MPLPPGPTEPPVVQTMRWLFRPTAFMASCRRRYGDAFSVRFLGFERPMVMVSDPDAVRAVYAGKENGLPPGRTLQLEPILGRRSVLLLEGSEHLARRKLMLPPFHGERMRAYRGVMEEAVRREIDSWPLHEPFAVHPRMQAVTLEVILRAVFGVTDPDRHARLSRELPKLIGRISSPGIQLGALMLRRLGRDPLPMLRRLTGSVDDVLAEEIASRREEDPNRAAAREDILALLMSARFEDGEPMRDEELRDQLLTLLLAGHETTASALAWTFDLLLRHPDAVARLRDEARAGEDDAYLRAVVSEALRLRPVVPIAGRRITRQVEVDGHELPAGTDITPSIWLAHLREEAFPEPFAFRPERFLEGGPETYSWIPFGGGVRRCLGAAFAEFEMRIVLREAVRRCDLRLAGAPERIARRNVTFAPRHGTRLVLEARAA